MFKAGTTYQFTIIEEGNETIFQAEVTQVEWPLIRLVRGGHETIINTTSALFVSASLPRHLTESIYPSMSAQAQQGDS